MSETFANKLTKIRTMVGYSLQDLGNAIGVSKQAIHKYESGQMMPDDNVLMKFSEFFSVPIDYFFNPEVQIPINLAGDIKFREGEKTLSFERDKIIKETEDFVSKILELERLTDNEIEFKNPLENYGITDIEDAEEAARLLRKKWKLGNAPIANVVSFLESKGIKVYEVKDYNYFEGFSAWAGKIPLIVINGSKKELTRIRFTALHELGHLVLQIDEMELTEELIEKICDAFASEMLLPTELIIFELGRNRTKISIEELKHLKIKYGISILAIMVRAASTKIINWDVFNSWKKQYTHWNESNQDFGKYYGNEEPRRLNQILHNGIAENKITLSKAASLFGIKENAFKRHIELTESLYN